MTWSSPEVASTNRTFALFAAETMALMVEAVAGKRRRFRGAAWRSPDFEFGFGQEVKSRRS